MAFGEDTKSAKEVVYYKDALFEGMKLLGTRGVLSVGGERLLRGEVIIDGTSRGFAPGRFELTAGAHRVEVRLPSGERVGPREWVVSVQHTASAPLTWEE